MVSGVPAKLRSAATYHARPALPNTHVYSTHSHHINEMHGA